MKVQQRTIEKIRNLINEEIEYRSGPKLVSFFNELGFSDVYGQGFPSRWIYTDSKLIELNDSPRLDDAIKKLLAPVNFIGQTGELDKYITELNDYLAYDGYIIERQNREISIRERTDQDDEIDSSVSNDSNKAVLNNGIVAGGSITAGGDIVVGGHKVTSSYTNSDEHWYQKPLGQIIIGLVVTVGGGAILYFLFGV